MSMTDTSTTPIISLTLAAYQGDEQALAEASTEALETSLAEANQGACKTASVLAQIWADIAEGAGPSAREDAQRVKERYDRWTIAIALIERAQAARES